jgi:hypothetical protein
MDRKIGMLVLVFAFYMTGFVIDKKELEGRYKDKYLVVLRKDLVLGVCGDNDSYRFRPVIIAITGDKVEFDKRSNFTKSALAASTDPNNCRYFVSEPVREGEALLATKARVGDDELVLTVETVSPHSLTRGKGAHEHESHESAKAELHFIFPKKYDYEGGMAFADKWIKPFDTLEAASSFGATLGNTASGAFVKEVKLGMTPAEVESVMGLPVSKADLGEKVLYKYKDMTIEFHDGKVTDVR